MYKQLINISDKRKELELELQKERAVFEDTIALRKAQLDDLVEKETMLKEEAILKLEQDDLDNIQIDDKLIIRQVRRTNQIEDPDKIMKSLGDYQKELLEIGINAIEVMSSNFEKQTVVKDKKIILDIADKLEKVEGIMLDGINIKETKFITIKNI